ncbi:hypothetical protein IFM89_030137 [Coptis chinensis]|uniref:Transposase n=1 Tax=Coptis chinensis TaxID=261450 RepID=A0A835LWY6_9MAGN|nr:hypothetical protein IFM89_030137 [Coptis chinensis]
MLDLVNDAFRRVLPESLDACMNELGSYGDAHAERGEDNNSENNSLEDIKAKKLWDDATQPLYPSCGVEEKKLSVIVGLVGLKSTHNWSNNSFDELRKTLKRVLPSVFSTMASRQAEGGSGSQQAEVGVDLDKLVESMDPGSLQVVMYLDNRKLRMLKIFVLFDEDGRPVGDKAAEYSSHLGEYSRAHASIAHHRWKNVSDDDKTLIWKRIFEEYDLSGTTKEKVMAKANEYWRKYKSSSLRKVYDKYRTDEERKRHCPGAVRKEDWEKFVDNESTEAAKSRRVNGKLSRQAAIARQRSGRKGSARIAHELKLKNSNVPVTRTDVYVVLHTNSDDTCPTQEHSDQVESIKEIVASNPARTTLDLDHDPVAQVLGRDTKGRFRGLGAGVSRRGLDASALAKNQLKMQKEMTSTLIGEVQDLKLLCGELQKDVAMMKSGQGSNVPFSPCSGSSQLNRMGPAPQGFPPDLRSASCKLYSMRREHVANGRAIIGEEVGGEVIETYDVILDSVLVPHAQSTNRATLGEEEIGSIVDWPKALTVFDH